MAIIIAIGAVLLFGFACMAVWNLMSGLELEPRPRPEVPPMGVVTTLHGSERCVLCDHPLRRAATSDDVVHDIERQIDDESAMVAMLLRRPIPENLERLYLQ